MAEGRMMNSIVVASLVLGIALILGFYTLGTLSEPPEVKVSGFDYTQDNAIQTSATATSYLSPDLLTINFRIETEDVSADDSQSANAAKTEAVLQALRGEGISEEKIKTVYYTIDIQKTSHYICRNRTTETDCYWEYVTTGFKTTHVISVEVEDIEEGGAIADTVIDAGATEIDYISFSLKEETRKDAEKELLEEAASKSKEKAEKIADGLGVSLGEPLSASESYYYDYPTPYRAYDYGMAAAEAVPETSFAPGEIKVSATVSTSFSIE